MPSPNTVGSGLMGYPSSVDTGQVQPFVLVNEAALSGGTASVVAGSAYFYGITLYTFTTIAQMRTFFGGAPTGNVDMGVYDATAANSYPGNLLGHTGINVAAAGLFTKSLTANLPLSPGQYWIAFLDTVTDTIPIRTMAGAGIEAFLKTVATNLTVLPATAGSVATVANVLGFEALMLNNFS